MYSHSQPRNLYLRSKIAYTYISFSELWWWHRLAGWFPAVKKMSYENHAISSFFTSYDTSCVGYSVYKIQFICHNCYPRTEAFISSCFFRFRLLNHSYLSLERLSNPISVRSTEYRVGCGSSIPNLLLSFELFGTHFPSALVSAAVPSCVAVRPIIGILAVDGVTPSVSSVDSKRYCCWGGKQCTFMSE